MNSVILDLQLACTKKNNLPNKTTFQSWLEAIMLPLGSSGEITIRIVDAAESQKLNSTYCGKNNPTNVLAFPFQAPPGIKLSLLGDLVICRQIVELEASKQYKTIESYWAHMVVHGTLHLIGYDHDKVAKLKTMEALETKIMFSLGYPNPYIY